jgi:hypothetical protein
MIVHRSNQKDTARGLIEPQGNNSNALVLTVEVTPRVLLRHDPFGIFVTHRESGAYQNQESELSIMTPNFAESSGKQSVRTKLIWFVYLIAIGIASVGWFCLLGWCALALLGF